MRRAFTLLVSCLFLFPVFSTAASRSPVRASKGMVVSAHPLASAAGSVARTADLERGCQCLCVLRTSRRYRSLPPTCGRGQDVSVCPIRSDNR